MSDVLQRGGEPSVLSLTPADLCITREAESVAGGGGGGGRD